MLTRVQLGSLGAGLSAPRLGLGLLLAAGQAWSAVAAVVVGVVLEVVVVVAFASWSWASVMVLVGTVVLGIATMAVGRGVRVVLVVVGGAVALMEVAHSVVCWGDESPVAVQIGSS